jgi:Plavaka transposase
MNDFERADIHELLSPDLLHQLIKGTFHDHLVIWVKDYVYAKNHPKAKADEIMDDIDRRLVIKYTPREETHPLISIAIVPAFSGLRRFAQGRGFKQWTGDDSKALMKVSLKNKLM